MTRRRLIVHLLDLVLVLLALTPVAEAKSGYYVNRGDRLESLELSGSSGFRISILSIASGHVFLLASHGDTSVAYMVSRRRARPGELRATFGKLGRLAVRFVPSGPPKPVPQAADGCRGPNPTSQEGHFVGTIHFRGEQGFTVVDARRAHGQVIVSGRRVCRRLPPHHESGSSPPGVSLSVHRKSDLGDFLKGGGAPSFNAYEFGHGTPLGGSVSYNANIFERRPRMTISRSVSASANPAGFAVSAPGVNPTTATVAPPAPFEGSAEFVHDARGGTSWSGDLSVNFPGRGIVSLAGPSYVGKLCRDLSCACPPGGACIIFGAV